MADAETDLYDFYRHGNVVALERDNGIRSHEVWYLLNVSIAAVSTPNKVQ